MKTLLIVANPKKWELSIPGVEVVAARKYVTEPVFSRLSGIRVFNLMHQHRYQSLGYYVSLLAEARGHRPVPSITTYRDLQTPAMARMTAAALNDLIQRSLNPIKSDHFTLSIYFGKNLAKRYDRLCREIFNRFHAHFLKVDFVRNQQSWTIQNISIINPGDIPPSHYPFIEEAAAGYFRSGGYRSRPPRQLPYSMAILHDPGAEDAPSNPAALKKFISEGKKQGIDCQLITRDDFGRLGEFDALFIRETTTVNNHTFRFARWAEAEGLVVMDDTQSIIRCANKVYLAEMLAHYKIPTPKTLIVHKGNLDLIQHELDLPCVLKQPDSAFSAGVVKASTPEELLSLTNQLLDKSELIIAQQFLPTEYDWRIGILENQPIFACRYYMARRHWQIVRRDQSGKKHEGASDTVPLDQIPPEALRLAVKAARAIGNGLYGVDIKQAGNRFYVIEVNDNPNVDAGIEDALRKNDVYADIMRAFRRRIEAKHPPPID